jgi:hypothetical protein
MAESIGLTCLAVKMKLSADSGHTLALIKVTVPPPPFGLAGSKSANA